jgi:hypothetical protein
MVLLQTLVYVHIKRCRMVFGMIAVALLSWMTYKYQDINHINNQLLVQIKDQNEELKNLLKTGKLLYPTFPCLLCISYSGSLHHFGVRVEKCRFNCRIVSTMSMESGEG